MLRMLFLIPLSLLVFSGCEDKSCTPIKEYVYIKRTVEPPLEKPKANEIELLFVKFNGVPYYVLDEREAEIFATNLVSYKHWAETNYALLKAESLK